MFPSEHRSPIWAWHLREDMVMDPVKVALFADSGGCNDSLLDPDAV